MLPNYRKLFADLKPGHQDPIKHDHTLDGSRFQKKIKRSYKKRKSKASKLKPVAKNRNRNHTRALLVLSLSRPAPDLFLSPRETGQSEISFALAGTSQQHLARRSGRLGGGQNKQC
jgi:hypothetical protein